MMCGEDCGRGVGVDQFFGDRDIAALAQLFAVVADGLHDGFAAGRVGVANIELQDDAAGNAVDRARMDVAGADGGDGVDRSRGEGVLFDGENELGGGAERVFAVGHQERSGMAAKAGDGEAIAGRRGDAGDDAERDAFALQQRPLLDVQLDPGVVVVGRELDRVEAPVKPAAVRTAASVRAVSVGSFASRRASARCGIESAGHEAAANAADAEAGRLLRGEHDELDGAARAKAAAFECAHRLQAAEDADGAVIHAGVWDGVGVGAGGYGGQVGFGPGPADEDVADGIVADLEAFGDRQFFQPGARAEVVGERRRCG